VSALKGASLGLRFLLELCVLAAAAYWGSRVSSSGALNVAGYDAAAGPPSQAGRRGP